MTKIEGARIVNPADQGIAKPSRNVLQTLERVNRAYFASKNAVVGKPSVPPKSISATSSENFAEASRAVRALRAQLQEKQ